MIVKRLAVIVVLTVFSTVICAQEIVDPAKLWSNMEEHCQPWGSNYSTEYIRFSVDTVIDQKVYKKVWISEDEDYEEWNFYGAFIREDSGRVFYRQMFGEEGLIYDFNLGIGDSVIINNPRASGEITLYFVEIDSVEIENGYRERWKLVSNIYENAEYWIRGIGSETGVINSGTGVFGGLCGLYTLLCEKENDELIYMNPGYESCYLFTTDVDEGSSLSAFLLSYDQDEKLVQVSMSKRHESTIIISNISGIVITSEQINTTLFTYDMSAQKTGIYIITVVDSGNISSQKFIVN